MAKPGCQQTPANLTSSHNGDRRRVSMPTQPPSPHLLTQVSTPLPLPLPMGGLRPRPTLGSSNGKSRNPKLSTMRKLLRKLWTTKTMEVISQCS
jgi:hypothetical protein